MSQNDAEIIEYTNNQLQHEGLAFETFLREWFDSLLKHKDNRPTTETEKGNHKLNNGMTSPPKKIKGAGFAYTQTCSCVAGRHGCQESLILSKLRRRR